MTHKSRIVILFCMIMVVSLGCIESQKLPNSNETKIATPEPTPSPTEKKLPTYNETKPLKINGTFETWSKGYKSNAPHKYAIFKVITNYSSWIAFLDEQGYFEYIRGGSPSLEGELYPGIYSIPKEISSTDFNGYFIIVALMGWQPIIEGPEIEIINISRINITVNVKVSMYQPTVGASAISFPYHIVIVKRELLPIGNSTFVFTDTEGKLLGKVEVNE